MLCCPHCSMFLTILNSEPEPESSLQSGVTMLNYVIDKIEEHGQHNIIQSCFQQLVIFICVYAGLWIPSSRNKIEKVCWGKHGNGYDSNRPLCRKPVRLRSSHHQVNTVFPPRAQPHVSQGITAPHIPCPAIQGEDWNTQQYLHMYPNPQWHWSCGHLRWRRMNTMSYTCGHISWNYPRQIIEYEWKFQSNL